MHKLQYDEKTTGCLTKYAIHSSIETRGPLPSHFGQNCFTIASMDNFENTHKNNLSGMMHTHDTLLTLFQKKLDGFLSKQTKSSTDLRNITKLNKLTSREIQNLRSYQKRTVKNDIYLVEKLNYDFVSIVSKVI